MNVFDVSAREKRSTFAKVLVMCLMAAVLAPPLAQAAVQAVRVKNAVKVKDTGGGRINSSAVPDMGLFGAEGSTGAIDVRNFAGGGGFLGAADCTETQADGLLNSVSITNSIVTGFIITGTDAVFTVTSDAVGGGVLPLLNLSVGQPGPRNFVAALPTGLTLTDALTFTCTGTNGNIVILGQ